MIIRTLYLMLWLAYQRTLVLSHGESDKTISCLPACLPDIVHPYSATLRSILIYVPTRWVTPIADRLANRHQTADVDSVSCSMALASEYVQPQHKQAARLTFNIHPWSWWRGSIKLYRLHAYSVLFSCFSLPYSKPSLLILLSIAVAYTSLKPYL